MDKYKKIYFFFQHLPPYPGAASRRAISLLSCFSRSKSECLIYTTSKSVNQYFDLKGFEIIQLEAPRKGNKSGLWNRLYFEIRNGVKITFDLCFKVSKKESLLVLSSPSYFTCLITGFFARIFKIPYVLDIRDIYPEVLVYSGQFSSKSPVYNLLKGLTIYVYRGAQLITTTNIEIEKTIKNYSNKTNVVYNGFPSSIMNISVVKHEAFTICFHGVIGRFQEIELLNEIINSKKLKHIQFIIIGYGPKEDYLKLGSENIHFLGKMDPTDTLKEITKCHLGLSFRTNDYISRRSFPVKNWEYLGAGIPVINYPRTEAGDFCEYHDIGLVFDRREVDEMVDKILTLSTFDEEYKKFKNNTLKIRENYTREISGSFFYNLIQKL